MAPLQRLRAWWDARKPLPLNKQLAVEFDNESVRVRVLERMEKDWEQCFRWEDIVRVCFKDGGIYGSDILFIDLRNTSKPAIVLTESLGGNEFFGALCGKGFFPDHVMRAAIGETGGGMHCWP